MTGSGKQRRLASGTRTAGRGLLQVLVVVVALVSTLAVLGMPAAAAAPPAIVHVPVVSTFVGKPIDIAATTEPRGVVGFEGFLGALLAALDGGVGTSIHGVVEQRHGLF